jgi:hypothetical protein
VARPIKSGLDYFPTDTDFLRDRKIRKIKRACGAFTIEVLMHLFCDIYGNRGYYVEWDDDYLFDVADAVGTKNGTVEEIVKKSVQVDLFDKDLFENERIITSESIQDQYVLSTDKRKEVHFEKKYLLTKNINRTNIYINDGSNAVNDVNNSVGASSNEQSKVNQTKSNQTKPSNDINLANAHAHAPARIDIPLIKLTGGS